MWVSLALRATEFTAGIKEAQQQVRTFAGQMANSVQGPLGAMQRFAQKAFLGVGVAAVAGFGLAAREAVNMNASLQTSQLQFETLMGDADRAKEHVAGLFDFAKRTPFETGPIIEASRLMQVFGGDALNTEANLTRVGDTAAAIGAPIEDISFWVGRAYAAIQGGQPFGEAAQNLMQLGAVSPAVVAEMNALRESGGSAGEIFGLLQAHMGSFSGAMEKQASTWSGLVSTFRDQLSLMAAQGLKPFTDALQRGLGQLVQALDSPEVQAGVERFATGLAQVLDKVIPFVVDHGPALLKLIGGLATGFAALMVTLKVSAAITALQGAFAAAGVGAAGATVATGGFLAALGPVLPIVAAVVGAVTLLGVAWANNWGGIRDKTAAAIDFISNVIGSGLDTIRGWWEEHGAGITHVAQAAYDLILGRVQLFFANMRSVGEFFHSVFTGDWRAAGEAIRDIWDRSTEYLINGLHALDRRMTEGAKELGRQFAAEWEAIDWDNLGRDAGRRLLEGLRSAVQRIKEIDARIAAGFDEFWAGLTEGSDAAGEAIMRQGEAAQVAAAGYEVLLVAQAREEQAAFVAASNLGIVTEAYEGMNQENRELALHLQMTEGRFKEVTVAGDKFAAGLDGLVGKVRAVRDELAAAEAAQEAYHAAFMAVQGDYTNQLPGADRPLVTPARDVAITTGGLSAEQVALLEQYQEEAQKAQQEIFNLTNGLGTYGLEQEKINERVAEAQGELEHYQALMAPLAGVVGETSIAHQGLAVNVDAVYQGIYDQLSVMPGAEQAAIAFATATGIMSDAQADAALKAILVKQKIEELALGIAQAVEDGVPVQQAIADSLAAFKLFQAELEGTVAPAVERVAADVPAHIVTMKENLVEEAMLAGAGLMTGMETGMVDNQHLATEAATAAGDAVIDATAAALGVESPSTITHQMGLDLMAGMQNGANEGVGTVVAALTTIGGNIIAGLVAGINAARQTVMNAIQSIADAIPQWLRDMMGIHSPARVTVPIGRAVVEGIVEGVIYNERTLQTALRKLTTMLLAELDLGDQVAGIAGGFAARFEEQITGPMAERLSELDEQLAGAAALYTDTMRAAGRDDVFADWTDPGEMQPALRQLAELRSSLATSGDWLGMMQIDEAMRALRERNELNAEYVQQQERLAELQRAQADMAFLRSQVELLALIAEHADELPADLLAGVQFGSGADPGALMDAMTAVLEQQVAEVNGALGESRPLQQVLTEGLDAPKFIKQIRPANEMWRTFTGAVKDFHTWLSGRSFKLDVRIGEIPDWAVPGSPLPIHTAWVSFAEAMQNLYFGDQLVTHFGRIATSGDLLMTFLMSMPDELEGLTEDINAIVFQHLDAFSEYFEIVQAGGEELEDLLEAFARYAEDRPISEMFQDLLGSFPEELLPFLESIAQMVADGVEGVEEYIASLLGLVGAVEGLEAQLDLARTVGNLAAGFADYFEIQVLRPLEQQLAGTNDMLGGMMESLAVTVRQQFGDSLQLPNILGMPTDQAVLAIQGIRHALVSVGSVAGQTQVDAILQVLVERNRLEREYEEQQQRMLRLEEQRAQLAFLQQQLDLIRLVTEEGLDASILNGLQFGLYADAGQLMDVMAAVMQELILTAQHELMIHSPSRPFYEFGQNVTDSMAMGIEDRADAAKRRLQAVMGDLRHTTDDFEGEIMGGEGFGDPRLAVARARRTIINGGYHVTINGSDGDALEQLQRQSRSGRSMGQRPIEVI